MAATVTVVRRGSSGDQFVRTVDVTCDNAYPAGGYPITPAQLGFGTNGVIDFVASALSKAGGWECGWNYTTNKLQVFDSSGAANAASVEITTATAVNGVVFRLRVYGSGQG